MRKFLFVFLALLLAQTLSAQEIRSLDIDVYIDAQGDALVKQQWDVTVVSGTEWYIPIGNLNGSMIRGLKVSESGHEFESDGYEWDVERSIVQKSGRCGIVDKGSNGVELCWGVGSYGDHKWTASYVVLGLVQSLDDYDAFNFMFINPGMVAPPKHASICFHSLSGSTFDTDSTRFWFFGCEGESMLKEDGSIFFETDRPMPSNGKLIAMLRFEKGMFNAHNVRDMKFETMQKKAFRGSSYAKKFSFDDLIDIFFESFIFIIAFGFVLLMGILWVKDLILKAIGRQWSPKFFGSKSVKGWEREAPFGGSIPVAAFLLKEGTRLTYKNGHPERAIGSYFLRWIRGSVVTPVRAEDGHFDLLFPEQEPDFSDSSEKSLYLKAFAAAGENKILEKGEFDSWAEKHFKSMAGWPDAVVAEGRSAYNGFKGDKVSEAAKLLKFKSFLNDFTLAREREVPEVALWGQYLEFAQLFGIADKVAEGFSKMYPKEFNEFSEKYGLDTASMRTVIHNWNTVSAHAYNRASAAKRSHEASSSSGSAGGFGGHSSFGGGGGFSGGGFGGGSR
ncbi:MAG: DUF2207 domain-containing protein [Bacteroidales bacterium]|nr:DUF2207 domain-containing protein [Bacteroidales bacterium]